ncbi:hypothetical protein [Roseibium litorale]|uniref:DUF995 domain-containing protein n=1 Tax=Roseibium litorale TaxID=2803841 RepID=A0ABR9CQN7_9HYPH|nr:hypothetical protein [Roseibium litorale]MBD8893175.1 hypothetical protein [Roseibium litorale]
MKVAFTTTIIFALSCLPALSKDLPKGAAEITDAQQIEFLSGKKIDGIFYGKKAGGWTVEWKADGSKIAAVTPTGKKTMNKTLKWMVKDGKLCEEGFKDSKMICGTGGRYFKSENTCFTTGADKKTVTNEFPC